MEVAAAWEAVAAAAGPRGRVTVAGVRAAEGALPVERRTPPSFPARALEYLGAYTRARLRLGGELAGELGAAAALGAVTAGLARAQVPSKLDRMPTIYALIVCAFSLICALSAVRVADQDRRPMWRDVASGVPVGAPVAARFVLDLVPLLLQVAAFAWPYADLAGPNLDRGELVLVFGGVAFASSGLGYLCAAWAAPSLAPILAGFLVCSFTGLLAGNAPTLREAQPSTAMRLLLGSSFGRWATECLTVSDFVRMPGAYQRALGVAMLRSMGIPSPCGPGDEERVGDYSMEALMAAARQSGDCGEGPLPCGPHLVALAAIGVAFRGAAVLVLAAKAWRLRPRAVAAEADRGRKEADDEGSTPMGTPMV